MTTLMSDEALANFVSRVIDGNYPIPAAVDIIKQQQQAAVGEVLGRLEKQDKFMTEFEGNTSYNVVPLTAIQAERTRNENGGKV